ncbi:MAG TPA: glycosyltransferase family 1 protein [Candidatus Saccharimonadales bacterium]|nr:glycosyltransferase family 1 protein [Candidatus Saccharimonadales bacterium]
MRHIAIDARIINTSTGKYIEGLLNHLQQIDKVSTYSILVPTKDKDFWKPTGDNFHVRAADFDNYSLSEQIGFKRYLDKLAPDLVHFCMPQQPILYKGKHVTTFHDLTLLNTYNSDKNWLVFHFKQMIGRFVFRRVLKTSKFILTPSRFTKNELLKFDKKLSPDKVAVTPEAADIFINELIPYKHSFKEYIMYVGQQSDYKNIQRLGEAHQKLLQKHPDLGLILVGKLNASAQINKQYFEANGFKNILFTDFLPTPQRDWLFKNTAAYVFPSLMEGFGLPGLEAMGYGAPVVSSNATCLPEVYDDAAHYFDPRNTDDMARAIDEVLTDDKLRSHLIAEGYKQIAKYSWERMAKQTHSIYIDAIRNYIRP